MIDFAMVPITAEVALARSGCRSGGPAWTGACTCRLSQVIWGEGWLWGWLESYMVGSGVTRIRHKWPKWKYHDKSENIRPDNPYLSSEVVVLLVECRPLLGDGAALDGNTHSPPLSSTLQLLLVHDLRLRLSSVRSGHHLPVIVSVTSVRWITVEHRALDNFPAGLSTIKWPWTCGPRRLAHMEQQLGSS